jgi:pseudouridylate synthase
MSPSLDFKSNASACSAISPIVFSLTELVALSSGYNCVKKEHGMQRFQISTPVQQAMAQGQPVVALETAVLTHGLPHPHNVQLSIDLEATARASGVTPATIGIIHGTPKIGLSAEDIEFLGDPATDVRKISKRDFGIALSRQLNGGTTVCATMILAKMASIGVFATGGIGGVHRGTNFDISADLPQLANTPMIVVCAGAKSILDLPNTREYLETAGVPVLGYQTDTFPAFFSPSSGLPVDLSVDSADEVANIARHHWSLGLQSSILLVVPPPSSTALQGEAIENAIEQAVDEAATEGIHGADTTPYLLSRVNQLTNGLSMRANLDLLKNNTTIASLVAIALSKGEQRTY